jgi:hypothetical protein
MKPLGILKSNGSPAFLGEYGQLGFNKNAVS